MSNPEVQDQIATSNNVNEQLDSITNLITDRLTGNEPTQKTEKEIQTIDDKDNNAENPTSPRKRRSKKHKLTVAEKMAKCKLVTTSIYESAPTPEFLERLKKFTRFQTFETYEDYLAYVEKKKQRRANKLKQIEAGQQIEEEDDSPSDFDSVLSEDEFEKMKANERALLEQNLREENYSEDSISTMISDLEKRREDEEEMLKNELEEEQQHLLNSIPTDSEDYEAIKQLESEQLKEQINEEKSYEPNMVITDITTLHEDKPDEEKIKQFNENQPYRTLIKVTDATIKDKEMMNIQSKEKNSPYVIEFSDLTIMTEPNPPEIVEKETNEEPNPPEIVENQVNEEPNSQEIVENQVNEETNPQEIVEKRAIEEPAIPIFKDESREDNKDGTFNIGIQAERVDIDELINRRSRRSPRRKKQPSTKIFNGPPTPISLVDIKPERNTTYDNFVAAVERGMTGNSLEKEIDEFERRMEIENEKELSEYRLSLYPSESLFVQLENDYNDDILRSEYGYRSQFEPPNVNFYGVEEIPDEPASQSEIIEEEEDASDTIQERGFTAVKPITVNEVPSPRNRRKVKKARKVSADTQCDIIHVSPISSAKQCAYSVTNSPAMPVSHPFSPPQLDNEGETISESMKENEVRKTFSTPKQFRIQMPSIDSDSTPAPIPRAVTPRHGAVAPPFRSPRPTSRNHHATEIAAPSLKRLKDRAFRHEPIANASNAQLEMLINDIESDKNKLIRERRFQDAMKCTAAIKHVSNILQQQQIEQRQIQMEYLKSNGNSNLNEKLELDLEFEFDKESRRKEAELIEKQKQEKRQLKQEQRKEMQRLDKEWNSLAMRRKYLHSSARLVNMKNEYDQLVENGDNEQAEKLMNEIEELRKTEADESQKKMLNDFNVAFAKLNQKHQQDRQFLIESNRIKLEMFRQQRAKERRALDFRKQELLNNPKSNADVHFELNNQLLNNNDDNLPLSERMNDDTNNNSIQFLDAGKNKTKDDVFGSDELKLPPLDNTPRTPKSAKADSS